MHDTWDCVSIFCKMLPLYMFQILMCLSAVPPPVASKFDCHGHQATALTAAVWLRNVCNGLLSCDIAESQMATKLSLAPLAKCRPSWFHLRPHTSCVCNLSVLTWCWATRTSWCCMTPPRDPLVSTCEFHDNEPTRLSWDFICRKQVCLFTSHSSTTLFERPTANTLPFWIHAVEHM